MPEGVDHEFTEQIEEKDTRDPLDLPVLSIGKRHGKEKEPAEKCGREIQSMGQMTPDEEVERLAWPMSPLLIVREEQRRGIVFHSLGKTMDGDDVV